MKGNFHTNTMAEAPKPILDVILAKAKDKQEIDLTKEELQDLARDKTVEEAKVQLDTRGQLNHLSGELKEERVKNGLEATSDNPDLGLAQQLEDVERRIDQHAATLPEAPAAATLDFKEPEAETANTNVFQKALGVMQKSGLKGFGSILRTLSDLMKVMPNMNLFGINLQQLNFFEKMYDKFFGATEARASAAALLKDSRIAVREGTGDSDAYGRFHTKYETQLNARLKLDANGKSPLSQVEQDGIRGFTFQKFLEKEVKDYGAKHGAGATERGKEKATTLSAIENGDPPATVDAGPEAVAVKPGESLKVDAQNAELDGRDLFGSFVDSASKTVDIALEPGLSLKIPNPVEGDRFNARIEIGEKSFRLSADMTGTPLLPKSDADKTFLEKAADLAARNMTPAQKLAAARAMGLSVIKRGGAVEINLPMKGLVSIDIGAITQLAKKAKTSADTTVDAPLQFRFEKNVYTVPVTLTQI